MLRINIFLLSLLAITFAQDPPPEFEFNTSQFQAFYFFDDALLDGETLESNDWVAAFRGDVCVGSRRWDTTGSCSNAAFTDKATCVEAEAVWTWHLCGGGVCDVPALGDDGSVATEDYLLIGEIPTFKIYDNSSGQFFDAYPLAGEVEGYEHNLFSLNTLIGGCSDDAIPDCSGECGGSLENDACGVCGGDDSACIPDDFFYNQSSDQAFYYFNEAFAIYNVHPDSAAALPLDDEDWIGAFNGDICIGAKSWDTSGCGGGICAVPVMGDDGEEYSTGYITEGNYPTFKIYDASKDEYYEAIPSSNEEWSPNTFHLIDRIDAEIRGCMVPEDINYNSEATFPDYSFCDVQGFSQNLDLHSHNNLVSFHTLPENDATVSSIFAGTLVDRVITDGSSAFDTGCYQDGDSNDPNGDCNYTDGSGVWVGH